MTRTTLVLTLLLALVSQISFAAPIPDGPAYPAPGGNDFGFAGDLGGVGGRDVDYFDFDVAGAGLVGLWHAVAPPWGGATAALDGSPDPLSFDSVAGATGTWTGLTDWLDPFDSTLYTDIPVKMDITITAGAVSWEVLPIAAADFDPAIGAVINNSAGVDYTINILFSADVGGGFVPMDTINTFGGDTLSSVNLGFYSLVPEPSSFVLAGVGLMAAVGVGVTRRRRRRA